MDDLTNTQLVLLAILISFVTSIGTGIITVSLLSEAPQSITQTINRVVEHTVEKVVTDPSKPNVITKETTVVVNDDDLIVDAINKNTKSVMRIRGVDGSFLGIGVVVSADGVVMVSNRSVASGAAYAGVFFDGATYPMTFVSSDDDNDVAFLKVSKTRNNAAAAVESIGTFSPITLGNSDALKLGQTVIGVVGRVDDTVQIGRISNLKVETNKIIGVETDFDSRADSVGGPLLDINGAVVGVKISESDSLGRNLYVPINALKEQIAAAIKS